MFELYDHDTQSQIVTYLALHDIDCLLPKCLNDDNSLTIAIRMDGIVRCIKIGG
jgi:hypothetical protein